LNFEEAKVDFKSRNQKVENKKTAPNSIEAVS